MSAATSRRGRRPRWTGGLVLLAVAVGVLFLAASASGNLSVGTFNAGNGDLTDTAAHDWNPADSPEGNLGPIDEIACPDGPGSGTNCAIDLVESGSDNALGQGAKEDDTTVSVVDGSIPPRKDDLSRFYVNQETGTNGHNLLYLAWERTDLLGSAHMDFELNQSSLEEFGLTSSSTGSVTLNRSPGDVLISFDFGGSGEPSIVWHKWLIEATAPTGTASADCEASNTFPCWSEGATLTGSEVEASVNGAPVQDYNAPVPGGAAFNELPGATSEKQHSTTISSTFGEAAIDLQAAGIFSTFSCQHFGLAWLKSRSSGSSFNSELKDFVAPLPVNISNCGTIKIVKHTVPRGIDEDFGYSTTVPSGAAEGAADFSKTPDTTGATTLFTLNDKDNETADSADNTETITNVPAGDYTVTETMPTGWQLESLVCSPTTGDSYGAQHEEGSLQADITVAPDGVVTCTYTNEPNLGAIVITKTGKDKNCTDASSEIDNGVCTGEASAKLGGATFKVTTDEAGTTEVTGSPVTTDDDTGTVCIDGLSWSGGGTHYYVTETGAPSGYAIDSSAAVDVTVTQNATCNAGGTDVVDAGTAATLLPFSDSPLTDISVTATAQVEGATKSTITCTGPSPDTTTIGSDGPDDPAEVSSTDLKPGIYTCIVDIDP